MPAPKQYAKAAIEFLLRKLVAVKLTRIKPTIIGVTGSVGKTTTKEAIALVLASKFPTFRPPKSYNTEIGLLLGVLNQRSAFSQVFGWVLVLIKATVNAFVSGKFRFLVLEYGADKSGDIQYLMHTVKPHIGVITQIQRVHQDHGQFSDLRSVFEEKKHLVTDLPSTGIAILNHADPLLRSLEENCACKIRWYNYEHGLSVSKKEDTLDGFSANIHYRGKTYAAHFPILGSFHIESILPALLIGLEFEISIEEGIAALQHFDLPPGRLSKIEGKNGSILLDSSYNASPQTVLQTLELLSKLPAKSKIAVLGTMNELGSYGPEAHFMVGQQCAHLDLLITVGDLAKEYARGALKAGLQKTKIKSFSDALSIIPFLEKRVRPGDLILFKGSQNKVRLERAVKGLMAHPEDAEKLLCRQEKEWETIT